MSSQVQRRFTTDFKEQAVHRLEAGERVGVISADLGIRRKLLYDWRNAYRRMGVAGLNRKTGPKALLSVVEGPGIVSSPRPFDPSDPPCRAERTGISGSEDRLERALARITELEQIIGRQQIDLDFFRRALRLTDAASASPTATASTQSSKL
jgi:transposase